MNRESKRKNSSRIKNYEDEEMAMNGKKLLKIIAIVVFTLLVLYYILAVFVTKEIDVSSKKNSSSTTNAASSVSNKILAKNTFNQLEEDYYVYYYDFEDEDDEISSTISNKSDWTIYKVDTKSALNNNYVTEDAGNSTASSINDLKVKNPTLIHIVSGSINGYYEGKDAIVNFLG